MNNSTFPNVAAPARTNAGAFVAFALSIVLAPCGGAVAQADQIKLANGDILNVSIIEVVDDHITFSHPVFGVMTLPLSAVTILPAPAPPPAAEGAAAAPPAPAAAPAGAPAA